jgi:hypothetical protein
MTSERPRGEFDPESIRREKLDQLSRQVKDTLRIEVVGKEFIAYSRDGKEELPLNNIKPISDTNRSAKWDNEIVGFVSAYSVKEGGYRAQSLKSLITDTEQGRNLLDEVIGRLEEPEDVKADLKKKVLESERIA